MGNDNSPEHSPNKLSQPKRILSNTKTHINTETPFLEKHKIIQNVSKLSKVLSRPKNIMNFISQTENIILLKNMNDSLNIGFNNLNIQLDNEYNNPFVENHLKYYQVVDDSIDKKILGKLNYQNKEYNQKQIEFLTNNLIEISNNNNINNINIDNISSIHKRNREESPNSQRDEELDLTSFSTTIGGKISSAGSNYNYNNSRNQNSKQIKTFKIRKKDGFVIDGNSNNINNNICNFKNNSSRHDSPNSIPSITSSNTISNVLSSINNTHFHSKNSSNTSLKDKNINIIRTNSNNNRSNSNNQRNNSNNNINNSNINQDIIYEENIPNNSIYSTKTHNKTISNVNNTTKPLKNITNKVISKKVVKKKIIGLQKKSSSPKDNIKSPRNNMKIVINTSDINNTSNIDNSNIYINNTVTEISGNNNKKIKKGFVIPKLNLGKENRTKSPTNILNSNNLKERESENSQIIFNNVRPLTQRHDYSYSNNNSSMINNLSSLNQHSKISNTNIINDEKYIKYLNDSNSSNVKTEPNKNNSYMQGINNKKKANNNPFKNRNIIYVDKNSGNKDIKLVNGKIIKKNEEKKENKGNKINLVINNNCINSNNNNKNILKKENKTVENSPNKNIIKVINVKNVKKVQKKDENNVNTENCEKKENLKNNKNVIIKIKLIIKI